MNQNGLLLLVFKHYPQACTTSGKEFFILSEKQPMEYHMGPAPDEKSC